MLSRREEFATHWKVVFAGFIGILTGAWAFPFFILGPLVKSFEAEFGWSRASIVACSTFLSLGMVIGSPIAGRLADRFGVRIVTMISMLFLTSCLGAITVMTQSWQLQALYLLMGMLGAGSGAVTYTRAIGGWFHAGRGLALGLILSGTGIASFISPTLVEFLAETQGWRSACLAVAGLTLFVGLPVIFFFLAEPPPAAQPASARTDGDDGAGEMTRGAALRDPRFLALAISTIALGLFMASLLIHLMPMLIDGGVSPARAAQIASVNGIAMVVGRLTAGPLLDRFQAAHVGAAIFLLGAIGAALFVAAGPATAIFMVAAIGFLIGAEMDLISYMVLHYFGIRSYGVLFGILVGTYSASGMASPLISSALIAFGGYDALYLGATISFLVAATWFAVIGLSRHGSGTTKTRQTVRRA